MYYYLTLNKYIYVLVHSLCLRYCSGDAVRPCQLCFTAILALHPSFSSSEDQHLLFNNNVYSSLLPNDAEGTTMKGEAKSIDTRLGTKVPMAFVVRVTWT